MLFNSIAFAIFLPIVWLLYWQLGSGRRREQNVLLLTSSYFFYGCWDWRFLFLLIFSTLLDYYTGLKMSDAPSDRGRRFWLWLSVIINLGFLGVFKYYNFFAHSFAEAVAPLGWKVDPWTISVILPVGISFYTFHGLSYVLDIYFKRIKAERNFVDYSVFVSFFPLLVAGPIERATHLLPQIKRDRQFDYAKAVDGLRQILWGLFKKIVIADQCAEQANLIFNQPDGHNGSSLALGAVFFAFQIYGDFSGYSDIALGTARLFGIELLRNFAYPYFSRDIAEFWRRWHISLSSWFRDYLYIPLGGSRGGTWMKVRNTLAIFVVSGFWHGANWTFIFWGLLNAIFILPSIVFKTNRDNLEIVAKGRLLPTFREAVSIAATFCLACFAWIFFRAQTLGDAFHFVRGIFSKSLFEAPDMLNLPRRLLVLMALFMVVEWAGREQPFAIARLGLGAPRPVRLAFYYGLAACLFYFANAGQTFIYFQF